MKKIERITHATITEHFEIPDDMKVPAEMCEEGKRALAKQLCEGANVDNVTVSEVQHFIHEV